MINRHAEDLLVFIYIYSLCNNANRAHHLYRVFDASACTKTNTQHTYIHIHAPALRYCSWLDVFFLSHFVLGRNSYIDMTTVSVCGLGLCLCVSVNTKHASFLHYCKLKIRFFFLSFYWCVLVICLYRCDLTQTVIVNVIFIFVLFCYFGSHTVVCHQFVLSMYEKQMLIIFNKIFFRKRH